MPLESARPSVLCTVAVSASGKNEHDESLLDLAGLRVELEDLDPRARATIDRTIRLTGSAWAPDGRWRAASASLRASTRGYAVIDVIHSKSWRE